MCCVGCHRLVFLWDYQLGSQDICSGGGGRKRGGRPSRTCETYRVQKGDRDVSHDERRETLDAHYFDKHNNVNKPTRQRRYRVDWVLDLDSRKVQSREDLSPIVPSLFYLCSLFSMFPQTFMFCSKDTLLVDQCPTCESVIRQMTLLRRVLSVRHL